MAGRLRIKPASATVTRPNDTTAYASGDLIANSTTAGSVTPFEFPDIGNPGDELVIHSCRVDKSDGTAALTARMHFFTVQPAVANGDNGAFQPTLKAGYVGAYDVSLDRKFSDGYVGHGYETTKPRPFIVPSGGKIWGLLEARAAYTPVAEEVFTASVEPLDL